MVAPWARFDDLRAGTALFRPAPSKILTAAGPEEVADPVDDLPDESTAVSSS